MVRHKGASAKPSLILRLRGSKDLGWQPQDAEPPPAIQIEAADELQRMEYLLTLHKNFLASKGLFVEFAKWAG
jgi:hypothetical protein